VPAFLSVLLRFALLAALLLRLLLRPLRQPLLFGSSGEGFGGDDADLVDFLMWE
jgi:hypothetical protein